MADAPTPAAPYQVGDIVFIRIANFFYRRVAAATNSWTSHVGMIDHREGSEWIVAESTIPRSCYTPLTKFLRRSEQGKHAVLRLQTPLDTAAQTRLQHEAKRRMGRWYDLGFDLDARHQFCSKFIYEVYRDAVGVSIGTIESFRDLLARNPHVSQTFWRFWFWGRIPWDRRTIAPGTQFESDLLQHVSGSGVTQ